MNYPSRRFLPFVSLGAVILLVTALLVYNHHQPSNDEVRPSEQGRDVHLKTYVRLQQQPSTSWQNSANRSTQHEKSLATTTSRVLSNEFCGCADCTGDIWNHLVGDLTCGQRITMLHETAPKRYSQVDACRQVALQFPCDCGGCDPARCNVAPAGAFAIPADWTPAIAQPPPPVNYQRRETLYCFSPPNQRVRYTMWDGMTVEVKEGKCGPSENEFVASNVEVTQDDDLILKYTKGQASEVRILLPPEQLPYSYGKYEFYVKSIQVLDAQGSMKSEVLPKELVLGLFTWNDKEDYAQHENWNHEVDIEISRWNCQDNADAHFVVQPPGMPQIHRFFTGDSATGVRFDQGDQYYSFTWNPGHLHWSSTAGGRQDFSLSTAETLYKAQEDFIQCLPDKDMEVRINLWNLFGTTTPQGFLDDDVVQVVVGSFKFHPSKLRVIPNGGICSKDCQCRPRSACVANRCSAGM